MIRAAIHDPLFWASLAILLVTVIVAALVRL